MNLRLSILIAVSALLVACQNKPPLQEETALLPETKTVNLPAYLLVKCPVIPKLRKASYAEDELVDLVSEIITQSDQCREKQSILVNTVVKAFNIKVVPAATKQPSK